MKGLNNLLLSLIAGALESEGETKLKEILQDLHDKNEEAYKSAIHGGQALVNALLPAVKNSKSKVDDLFISSLADAIADSAKDNGMVLQSPEEE